MADAQDPVDSSTRALEWLAANAVYTRRFDILASLSLHPSLASWFTGSIEAHLVAIEAAVERGQISSAIELVDAVGQMMGRYSNTRPLRSLLQARLVVDLLTSSPFDFGCALATLNNAFPSQAPSHSGESRFRRVLLRALYEVGGGMEVADLPSYHNALQLVDNDVIRASIADLTASLEYRRSPDPLVQAARGLQTSVFPSSQGSQRSSPDRHAYRSPSEKATVPPRHKSQSSLSMDSVHPAKRRRQTIVHSSPSYAEDDQSAGQSAPFSSSPMLASLPPTMSNLPFIIWIPK